MSAPAPQPSSAELRAADAESRVLAQTCFDRPLVLEAGAGTGKTTALVSRIVVWALGEGWTRAHARIAAAEGVQRATPDRVAAQTLQRIVAITFTEAAAAEMACRVGETLAKIAADAALGALQEEAGLYGPALPQDGALRRARAKALVGALDRLVVRTIHAFARRLLAAHPVEAGLHPAFEVDGDGRAAAEVVRELLELRLRDAYAEPGDPVLLALAARGVTAPALEETLLALVAAATPPAWLEEDPFDSARVESLRAALVSGLEAFVGLVASRLGSTTKAKRALAFTDAAGLVSRRLQAPAGGGVAGFEALQSVVRDGLGARLALLEDWRKATFNQTEASALADVRDEIVARAADLHSSLAHLCGLDATRLDLARRALAPLVAETSEALRLRGLVSYEALLHAAASLLSESDTVAARERAQIDQLLVDEFQDTDAVQCRMIAALALEGPAGERPGLFLVGDPKQSIYGWRGADLAAYDEFVARVEAEGMPRRTLCVNRRSVQPVLDEVACVIRPVMHAVHGLQPRFEPLLAHREHEAGFAAAGAGPVEYWISRVPGGSATPVGTRKPDATRLEARALARDIARLVRECGVEPSSIGVLLRGFGDVEEYLSALREAGVPYAVARDRSYYRRREIVDATCLVRCVVDPADALAFVAFLRSAVGCVPDAALLPLWREHLPALAARLPSRANETLVEIRAAVSRAAAAVPADVPGIERLRGWEEGLLFALEGLCALRRSFEADSSDLFVERLRRWLLFEAAEAARPLGAFRLANLDRFFRELGEALAEGSDPAAVLRHLRRAAREEIDAEEGRPLDAAEQAVQVMSIHKAKGLGFAHTYVMQLHKEPGGPRGVAPPRVVREPAGVELRLLGERTPGFLAVEAREKARGVAEDVRTLYVAMTRAKDRLVLAGLWPEAGSRCSVAASHVAVLRQREAGVPDLGALCEALPAEHDRVSAHGALWVFPAVRDAGDAPLRENEAEESGGGRLRAAARFARAEADGPRVAAARETARARMQRRFGGPASHAAHEAMRELFERRREEESQEGARAIGDGPWADGAGRAVATAVGTAVHRALEGIDLVGDPDAALASARATIEATLAAQLAGAELERARVRSQEALEAFRAGGLFERLRTLAPHIVARELPVLLSPGPDDLGPVAVLAGSVDLVYLDPESGAPVVADYKTDRIDDGDEMRRRTLGYAEQGAPYVRAVREAFGLASDPRFELWYLHAGKVALAR